MATIQFDRVTKMFGEVRALDAVSFSAGDGEFVVLVGPSGCGKSTALRLVAGLEEPDAGCIRIDGQDVTGRAPKERGCAMVFQSYALYPHWSVYDNLAFPLRVRRMARDTIDQRVRAIATDLKLVEVLNRRPKALSGGQRQRVALGRAMAADPAILLFDEPLSNLDAPLRAGMRAEIVARQKSSGKTSLYVTHDQAEALTMADRIVVLEGGRVRGIGPPEDLYRDPPNRFVATFLGRPTINILEARLQTEGNGCSLRPMNWTLPDLKLAPHDVPGTVQAGVRPEHLMLRVESGIANGRVVAREFLGDRVQYDVEMNGFQLTVLAPASGVLSIGANVCVTPEGGAILLFHPNTGDRLI